MHLSSRATPVTAISSLCAARDVFTPRCLRATSVKPGDRAPAELIQSYDHAGGIATARDAAVALYGRLGAMG